MFRGLLLLLVPALAAALDPTLAISQYARKHWQVEEGLPQNYVTAITQAPDGALLVGTSGGVVRFDGVQFLPIVLDPVSGLTREWINSLLVDSGGTLWIGSRDAGLFQYRDGRTSRPSTPELVFSAMARGADGDGIAAGPGLWRLKKGEWSQQVSSLAVADLNWQGLLQLPGGAILAGTTTGLQAIRGDRSTMILPDTGPAGRVVSLRLGRDGAIYAGTTRGLYRLSLSGDRAQASAVEGVPGPVVSIVEDRDGMLWAATWGKGLFRVRGSIVKAWTNAGGLPDDFVHTVYEDTEGSVWVGTRGGLTRLTTGPIVPHGPAEGLGGQFVSAVAGGLDGTLWLGTWRSGLYRSKGGVIAHVDLGEPDLTTLVRSLAVAPDNTLWMSDWLKLRHFDGSRWRDYTSAELGHDSRVNTILIDRDGSLWLGTPDGLHQYPPGAIRAPGRARLQGRTVQCLLRAKDGTLWVGTDRGLVAVQGESAIEVKGLPHPSVIALAQDAEGRVWAATRAGGLSRVSPGGAQTLDRRGLPSVPVLAILDDTSGGLWLSTSAGLYQLPKGESEALRFGQQDGMRTIEFQNVGQPAAWRDGRGSLWFTTVRGAVEVRPGRLKPLAPPEVMIVSAARETGGHIVRYTAMRLSAPHRLEFRYRLEPEGVDWTTVGGERTLRFSSLTAGTHTLSISAREMGGAWGPAATVDLTQPPRWYETWWFRVLLAALAGLLLWLIYRWRMMIVRGRYSAVLAERNRIAREWHDTLLAGFSAISWQLDATLGRLREKPDTAQESVELAGKMVRHYRAEARRVIWDLRNDQPEAVDLAASIRQALEELTRDSGVSAQVNVEGEFPALPGELSLNLLRIAQEAAGNAFRHASPSRIEARLRAGGGFVEIEVNDDGRGFDPARVPAGHFGLAIMRERAERFAGRVGVESSPGSGTIVSARIPWTP